MAFVAADWKIAVDGRITYIGNTHDGASPSYCTVIEFHRALQDFADDQAASGDDILDISDLTPSDRSTDNIITLLNGYFLDDGSGPGATEPAYEHIYDGSIIEAGGDTVYDGIVNFGNANVEVGIIQNGAVLTDDWWNSGGFFGTMDAGSGATTIEDTGQTWTTNEWVGYVVRNTTDNSAGLVTSNDADTLTISGGMHGGTNDTNASTNTYYISKGLNSDATGGISHRFMIKTRDNGVNIDSKKIIGFNRTYGKTYGEFTINATASGNNVLALSDATDLNNATDGKSIYTSAAFVSPFSTIANSVADGDVQLIDVDNDTTNEEYYSEWNKGSASINQFYEYCKYVTRYGADETTELTSDYGFGGALFRGVTHSFAYDGLIGSAPVIGDRYAWGLKVDHGAITGAFAEGDAVSFASGAVGRVLLTTTNDMVVRIQSGSAGGTDLITNLTQSGSTTASAVSGETSGGGTMYVLAEDGTADIYVQLLNGTIQGNDVVLYRDAGTYTDTITANGTATSRSLTYPFVGQSTGSALIGAYGVGVETGSLTQNDLLTSLDGNTYQPPNNVTFTVGGLYHGEDRVLVTWDDGSAIDKNQLALSTTLSGAAEGSVVVTSANPIPSDTPSSGTLRVVNDSGFDVYLPYSSFTGSTFTLTSSYDFSGTNENDAATVTTVTAAGTFTIGQEYEITAVVTTTDWSGIGGPVSASVGDRFTATGTTIAGGNADSTAVAVVEVYITYIDELASSSVIIPANGTFTVGTLYEITVVVTTTDWSEIGGPVSASPGDRFTATGTTITGGNVDSAAVEVITSSTFTVVYNVDRDLFIRVRDGGTTPIKTFETTGTLTNTGGSVTAIRTADT